MKVFDFFCNSYRLALKWVCVNWQCSWMLSEQRRQKDFIFEYQLNFNIDKINWSDCFEERFESHHQGQYSTGSTSCKHLTKVFPFGVETKAKEEQLQWKN